VTPCAEEAVKNTTTRATPLDTQLIFGLVDVEIMDGLLLHMSVVRLCVSVGHEPNVCMYVCNIY